MTPHLSVRKSLLPTLLCLLAFAAGDASAASLTVSGWTLGESVNVVSASENGWVNTAQLDLTVAGNSGYSYCVDLAQSIGPGTSGGWSLNSPELSNQVIRAAWLVDTFEPQIGSMVHPLSDSVSFGVTRQTAIAALQVAVWEVMAETPGNYNLYSGSFAIAAGGASDGVMNLSRDFLNQLGAADLSSYSTSAIWAVNATKQDQLFFGQVNPIPEPGTVALYAFGAAIAAFAVRRKAA
ncbi:MAG: hypothetical protein ACHQ6T_14990 [Myxococcota bacterium]